MASGLSSIYLWMDYSFSLCALKRTWNVAVRSRQSLARHSGHAHVNRRATQGQSAHAAAQSREAGILSRAGLALQADVEVYKRAGGSAPLSCRRHAWVPEVEIVLVAETTLCQRDMQQDSPQVDRDQHHPIFVDRKACGIQEGMRVCATRMMCHVQ